jgi:hypothetical protein
MNPEFNAALYTAVANRIEQLAGTKPDLFTPAAIASLLNERVITEILDGGTIGVVGPDPVTGEQGFQALFSPSELAFIRGSMLGPFAPEIQVGVNPEEDFPLHFSIDTNELGPPTEEILGRSGNVILKSQTYHIPHDRITRLPPEET